MLNSTEPPAKIALLPIQEKNGLWEQNDVEVIEH